jgi:adenylate cyclase
MATTDIWAPLTDSLLGPAELTTGEVAAQAGFEPDQARRLWRALGFPPVADDERLFTRADAAVLHAVRELIELQGTDWDTVIQLTRVIGQSVARIADAQLTATADRIETLRGEDGFDDAGVAALIERVTTLAPRLEQSLGYVWRRHLLAALRRIATRPAAGDCLTVGFADLVGFTAFSRALDAKELARIVDRFEAIVYEHVPDRGGRVVKLIGDEVMYSAEEPAVAAEIALALTEAHAREPELPNIRGGVACGPVLAWEGDLFGPTVNLASRLVNFARPGTVLVCDALGETLREHSQFTLHHLRAVPLKGFGRVRSWVLRRGEKRDQ